MTSSGEGDLFDDDVFEINDFTVVTAFEALVVSIESAIHSFGVRERSQRNEHFLLNRSAMSVCEWDANPVKLVLGDNNAMKLTYYWPRNLERTDKKRDSKVCDPYTSVDWKHLTDTAKLLMSTELDFCPGSVIASQFGVLEFLLLSPFDCTSDAVVNEDQLNTILSATNCALSTTKCELPVLVQYGDIGRHLYFGTCQNHSVRTQFQSVHLSHIQPTYSHLSGLIELFADKAKCELIDTHTVRVSVQVDFTLSEAFDDIPNFSSVCNQFDDAATPNELFVGGSACLPCGAVSDILDSFTVHATWPNMRQETLNENDSYSDLDPLSAPFWSASVSFHNGMPCLMNNSLKKLLDIAKSAEGKLHVLDMAGMPATDDALHAWSALSPIAEPRGVSITNTGTLADYTTAMSQSDVTRWIDAIFADVRTCEEQTSTLPETSIPFVGVPGEVVREHSPFTSSSDHPQHCEEIRSSLMNVVQRCKAAPCESVAGRVAMCLTYVLCCHQAGVNAGAQLWCALVNELRARWQCGTALPGMEENTTPDFSMALFHQKLQMLQSCIHAREKRHRMLDDYATTSDNSGDIFYDAEDWLSEESDDSHVSVQQGGGSGKSNRPRGRKRSMASLYLLNDPEVIMYEPFTQERCPMTEDMLERQIASLSALDSVEARTKLHIDSLLSDMQAFKAANPGCVFADFVRWHSPRDFVIDETTNQGSLSNRMSGDKNTWKETWDEALPCPVPMQKRLFNEAKEAELILQELAELTVSGVVELTLPIVLNCAAMQLVEESTPVMCLIRDELRCMCNGVSQYSLSQRTDDCLSVIRDMFIVERTIAKYNSLWARFTATDHTLVGNAASAKQLIELLLGLLSGSKENMLSSSSTDKGLCVPVDGGADGTVGMSIRRLFSTDSRLRSNHSASLVHRRSLKNKQTTDGQIDPLTMPPHQRRQYTLHWLGGAPRPTTHRMFASLSDEETRLCIASTHDTVLD